jgi:hypothetical protein
VQFAKKMEVNVQIQHEPFEVYMKRVLMVSMLVVFFFVYPSVCQAVLSVFSCYHLDGPTALYPENLRVSVWSPHRVPQVSCYTFPNRTNRL